MKNKRTPKAANTEIKLSNLKKDNVSYGDYWLLTNTTTVNIVKQKNGEQPTERITISKRAFNHFIKFYTNEQRTNT